jgi:hypothetical protein
MKLPRRKFLHLTAGAAALPIVLHAAWAGPPPTSWSASDQARGDKLFICDADWP